jgi:transcriptional regulator with XRE-family HTH domain
MARLPNYLRSHRKRLALSQEEVAFLLGAQNGANVSRHEQFAREPSLATALAYEVVLQKPASELFAGLYQQIQQDVAARAKTLAHRIDREKPNSRTALRRQLITSIASKSLN